MGGRSIRVFLYCVLGVPPDSLSRKGQSSAEPERFFTLEYWQDEGWFVGRLKEVPGVFSQGETLAALKENVADAYRMMLECERE